MDRELKTCFGCGEDNPHGLQLGPHARIEDGEIRIDYEVPVKFAGFKGVVHGGILATILDEAMSMANSWVQEVKGAVTASMQVSFKAPVMTETPIEVRARSVRLGRKFECSGEICDTSGRELASATSLWVLPSGHPGV